MPPITDFTNITFAVEDGHLVMAAVAGTSGEPYRHTCPLASYEAVAHALAEAGTGGITRADLHERTGAYVGAAPHRHTDPLGLSAPALGMNDPLATSGLMMWLQSLLVGGVKAAQAAAIGHLAAAPMTFVASGSSLVFWSGVHYMAGDASWRADDWYQNFMNSTSSGSPDPNDPRNRPPLQRIHSDETLNNARNRGSTEYWQKQPTRDIVDSLRPPRADCLKVKPDGRIMDGNTRVYVLEQRGYDVNSLPREIVP